MKVDVEPTATPLPRIWACIDIQSDYYYVFIPFAQAFTYVFEVFILHIYYTPGIYAEGYIILPRDI